MSILNRFSDIVNSNVNSMLDQAEDPRKMVSFITREMEQTLVAIRTESTRFLAARKRLVHKHDQLMAESDQWQQRAELAIEKARDDLAKAALKEKNFIRRLSTSARSRSNILMGLSPNFPAMPTNSQKNLNSPKRDRKS